MWCRRTCGFVAAALSLVAIAVPRSLSAQRRTTGAIPELTAARAITPTFHRLPPTVAAAVDTIASDRSRRVEHAKVGAVVGGVIGGLLGGFAAAGLNDLGDGQDAGDSFVGVLVAALGGALIFGLIGAGIGALVP